MPRACLSVVEADPETGGLRILKYLVVEDCGPMINPMIVEGQVRGGVAQGIGNALLEEFVYDAAGQPLTTTFLDYALPSAAEIPPIEIVHLETPSPYTIGGVKGMGEGGSIAPAAVLAAAVDDAFRVLGPCFATELPISPERIARLADEARAAHKPDGEPVVATEAR